MNNDLTQLLGRLRADHELYARHCLKILDKNEKTVPLCLNRAQRVIHQALEKQLKETGSVRALILKGRQQGACLAPETRVLTADLRWVRIDGLAPGQQIVATEEDPHLLPSGRYAKGRKLLTATVYAVVHTELPAYCITLNDGRKLVCSGLHHWLVRHSQAQWSWRSIEGPRAIRVGWKLRSVTIPWGDASFDDGWFGGMIDGEGHFEKRRRPASGLRLAISQRAGAVLDRMLSHCEERGYGAYVISDDGPRRSKFGLDPVHAVCVSNTMAMFRIMGLARPTRYIGWDWWSGLSMPDGGEREIVSIEPVGKIPLVDIQTSTGTFIAEGIVSHNSTYIVSRHYHRVSMNFGVRAIIMAHQDSSTQALFQMVDRYQRYNPLAPHRGTSNMREMVFDLLDSGYKVATAGSKEAGRSWTARLFHASEFSMWKDAQKHLGGVGNAVPDLPGTEIIIESTACGQGNAFHLMWQAAEEGDGPYTPIFIPWYWQDEYRARVGPDFQLSPEDLQYQLAYGLDLEQMAWRANKIATYGHGFEWLFLQEYPATAAQSFVSATDDPLVPPTLVAAAVNSNFRTRWGAYAIGCDPAEGGKDRTSIVWRHGRIIPRCEYYRGKGPMEVAGILARYWQDGDQAGRRPDALFVDRIGIGAGIVDRLRELNIPVIGVNSAETAMRPDIYLNLRAEMWWKMKEWFEDTPCTMLRDQALISDISAPSYETHSDGRRQLESKLKMRKRGIRSPDGGDALALTFAQPVEPSRSRVIGALYDVVASPAGHRPASRAGY